MIKYSFVLILVVGTILSLSAAADDFVYHGSFLWNDIRAVVSKDTYLLCAFHDGVGTIDLDSDFGKKKLQATLPLDGQPRRLYLHDDILIAETESGVIHLIDVSDPLNLHYLGSFTPEIQPLAMVVLGDYLYAAMRYSGLFRYDISDPSAVHLDDSSLYGIRVIKLAVYQSRLYALDDYNGVLIYEPTAAAIGLPVSQLLLPKVAISFAVANDTIYAPTQPSGVMVGSVSDVYNPQYLELRTTFIRGDYVSVTSQGVVLANSINGFELLYGGDEPTDQLFPLTGIRGYSDVFAYDGRWHIVYPHDVHGFVIYEIDEPLSIDIEYPAYVYAYPGPITQVAILQSRLHTVGIYNWYEIYDIDNPDEPFRSGKMINPPYRPVGVCAKGDTLFVADLATKTFFPAVDDGIGDPRPIFPFFSVADSIERPYLIENYFEDGDLLYFHNPVYLNGTLWTNSYAVPNFFRWSFATGIEAVAFDDDLLYRVSSKANLVVYKIDRYFDLEELARVGLHWRAYDMIKSDSLLYMASDGLRTYALADSVTPVLVYTDETPGTMYELQRYDDWLICAARNGIFIYDIASGIPRPLFSGGDRAYMVSYANNTIAASDSFSVKLYTLPISDIEDELPLPDMYSQARITGYPNPFNPQIRFVLENFASHREAIAVNIYDILGRKVKSIPVAVQGDGRNETSWDGRDDGGHRLPSGIYLVRAVQGETEAVFKAVLLK